LLKAIDYFNQAIALDANYALVRRSPWCRSDMLTRSRETELRLRKC
jgi:hypothetical protein